MLGVFLWDEVQDYRLTNFARPELVATLNCTRLSNFQKTLVTKELPVSSSRYISHYSYTGLTQDMKPKRNA